MPSKNSYSSGSKYFSISHVHPMKHQVEIMSHCTCSILLYGMKQFQIITYFPGQYLQKCVSHRILRQKPIIDWLVNWSSLPIAYNGIIFSEVTSPCRLNTKSTILIIMCHLSTFFGMAYCEKICFGLFEDSWNFAVGKNVKFHELMLIIFWLTFAQKFSYFKF